MLWAGTNQINMSVPRNTVQEALQEISISFGNGAEVMQGHVEYDRITPNGDRVILIIVPSILVTDKED